MHDSAVTARLGALARDAAQTLRELGRGGEEIPFGLTGPGEGSPFAQYAPMTGRFVREHWARITELDAFREARDELARAGVAAAYLERLDEPVPPDEARRAEAAAIAFLARLWDECADFVVDGDRLATAISELEGCSEQPGDEAELVAPLLGFHMPVGRLELGDATIVRGDLVDVPEEVRQIDGTRRSVWEPLFIAVVTSTVPLGDREEAASPGTALRDVVRALRLFKAGGVGLAPYAWARTPGDRWRRLPTGAARPRAGGLRLAESELGDLSALARALSAASISGLLSRAISRFEVGLERPALLEALSDYVLTLRYLLEGGGPAGVGLAMRAAALAAEPDDRSAVRRTVERALALEGELMRGEIPARAGGPAPLELVAGVEEMTRGVLRDAVAGRLGSDLRAAADEALLAGGLAAGEGAVEVRGATAEWDAIEIEDEKETPVAEKQENEDESPTTQLMGTQDMNTASSRANVPGGEDPGADDARARSSSPPDWLSEVDSRGDTLDWPERPEALRILDRRPQERERARRRVRHLFPRPETTDWRVAELQYERRKRARV